MNSVELPLLILLLAPACHDTDVDSATPEPEPELGPLECSSEAATCARVLGQMGPLSYDFELDSSEEGLVAAIACDPDEGSISLVADETLRRRLFIYVPDQEGAMSFDLGEPPLTGAQPGRADFAELGGSDMQVGTWAYTQSDHELIYGLGTGEFSELGLSPGDMVHGTIVVTSGHYKAMDNKAYYSWDVTSVEAWPGEVSIEFRGPCAEE